MTIGLLMKIMDLKSQENCLNDKKNLYKIFTSYKNLEFKT